MKIEKRIEKYLVDSGDSVSSALVKINENKSKIVFVVESGGVLAGSLSDGDIRRWMIKEQDSNLKISVDQLMNPKPVFCRFAEGGHEIQARFSDSAPVIPLVDSNHRVVAIAKNVSNPFQIGKFTITNDGSSFIIAEIGNNHNGDKALAKRLVDFAKHAGADCVKFQMRSLKSLYTNQGKNADATYDLGSQYTLELLNKFQLSDNDMFEVFDYCYERGILPLCTPWDVDSLRKLEAYGMEGYKVASADFTNFELLEELAKTNKPLICSTGMSTEAEIESSLEFLSEHNAKFAILHCNSTYPTPFKDVNLFYMTKLLENNYIDIVGYSGHERGIEVPIAAVALGARIIEKHFTVDKSMEGNDHKVSLLPEEFAKMVNMIRNVERALGTTGARKLTQGEMINRETLAKSLVINTNLKKGDTILREMISVKAPGQGIQPNRIEEVVGSVAKRDFFAGDVLYESDISKIIDKKSYYQFSRPYGIPVRYHDYGSLTQGIALDFVEFHLSYHDLDVNLGDFFDEIQSIDFAVHSPELFSGDHILDLASSDEDYRLHSIKEIKRVIDVVHEIKKFFPKTKRPVLILNAGGWSKNDFLPKEERVVLYQYLKESLLQIDLHDVELAIQTMPPFPWHFGGQSYHNIFVDPDEIVSFCEETNTKICLDVSHSMMACNYYKLDFQDFLRKVLPYTVHLHVVDAQGVDGEGVQIGCGDVDFAMLQKMLEQYAKNIQFIPEVWQGHKDGGAGFWSALAFLEKYKI